MLALKKKRIPTDPKSKNLLSLASAKDETTIKPRDNHLPRPALGAVYE
jgi:hypothetical protein